MLLIQVAHQFDRMNNHLILKILALIINYMKPEYLQMA